jgi:hypothetical protein
MTHTVPIKPRTGALALFSLLPLLWSAHARAADSEVDTDDDKDDAPVAAKSEAAPAASSKPTEGAKGPAHESLVAPTPAPVEPEEPPPVGPVERLPPTAYPEWKTRGISGGSLAFSGNMHGMPWPYYPKTGIGVSGSLWIDTGYETIKRGNPTDSNAKDLVSQGRAVLRVTPTYSSGSWYAQAQTELVGNKDQSVAQPNVVDIDDLWIRAGQWKTWDVQLGRFEAFEVYHFGMGMDLNTLERLGAAGSSTRSPPDVFELGGSSNIVYRQSGITNLAAHFYPTDFLRLEMLGQFGFDTASGIDTIGARPAAVLDLGWMKLKAAADVRKQFPAVSSSKESRTLQGGSAALQFVVDPILELGVNLAYGSIRHYSPTNSTDPNATLGDFDTAGSVKDLDLGGFANFRAADGLVVGAGLNENQETDQQAGSFAHVQGFGAIQYLVLKQLYIKLVGAYAVGHLAPGGVTAWNNTMESGRLRLLYLF